MCCGCARRRRRRDAGLRARFPRWSEAGTADAIGYGAAAARALKEPVPVEYARSFLPVLLIVLVLRSFLVEPFQIPSSSMVPTLLVGDYILVNKFAYGIRLPVLNTKVVDVGSPQRGDVMVFFPPNDKRYFIKRVIGLPGDRIAYRDKVLYVNGEADGAEPDRAAAAAASELPDPGRGPGGRAARGAQGVDASHPGRLRAHGHRPGHYFMMGDNRDNSSDSRVWGEVPERNIVGKAFAIWMHWGSFFTMPSFDRVGTIR